LSISAVAAMFGPDGEREDARRRQTGVPQAPPPGAVYEIPSARQPPPTRPPQKEFGVEPLSQYPPGVQFIFEGFEGGKARFRAVYPEGVYETVYMDPVFSSRRVYAEEVLPLYSDKVFRYFSEPEVLYTSEPRFAQLEAVLRPQAVYETAEAAASQTPVATAVVTVSEYVPEVKAILSLEPVFSKQVVYETVEVSTGGDITVRAVDTVAEYASETFVAKGSPEMLRGPPSLQEVLRDLDSRLDKLLEALNSIAVAELAGAVAALKVRATGLKTQIRILLSAPSIDAQQVARLRDEASRVEASVELLKRAAELLQQLESVKSNIPSDRYSDLKKRLIDAASKIAQLDPSGTQLLSQIEAEIQGLLRGLQQTATAQQQMQQAAATAAGTTDQLVRALFGADVNTLYDRLLRAKAALLATAKGYSRDHFNMLSSLLDSALSALQKAKQGQELSSEDLVVLYAANEWAQKILDNVRSYAEWVQGTYGSAGMAITPEMVLAKLQNDIEDIYQRLQRGERVDPDAWARLTWGIKEWSGYLSAGIVQLARSVSSQLSARAAELDKDNPALAWMLRLAGAAINTLAVAGQYTALKFLTALTGGLATPIIAVSGAITLGSGVAEYFTDPVVREGLNKLIEEVQRNPQLAAELGLNIASIVAGILLARKLDQAGLAEQAAAWSRNKLAEGLQQIAQKLEQYGLKDAAQKVRAAAEKVRAPTTLTEYKTLLEARIKRATFEVNPDGSVTITAEEEGVPHVTAKTIGREVILNTVTKLQRGGMKIDERQFVSILETYVRTQKPSPEFLDQLLKFLAEHADPETAARIVNEIAKGTPTYAIAGVIAGKYPVPPPGSDLYLFKGGKVFKFKIVQTEGGLWLDIPEEWLSEVADLERAGYSKVEAVNIVMQRYGIRPEDFLKAQTFYGRTLQDILNDLMKTGQFAARPAINLFLDETTQLIADPVKGTFAVYTFNKGRFIESVIRAYGTYITPDAAEMIGSELRGVIVLKRDLAGRVAGSWYYLRASVTLPKLSQRALDIIRQIAGRALSLGEIEGYEASVKSLVASGALDTATGQQILQALNTAKQLLTSGKVVPVITFTQEFLPTGASAATLGVVVVGSLDQLLEAAVKSVRQSRRRP